MTLPAQHRYKRLLAASQEVAISEQTLFGDKVSSSDDEEEEDIPPPPPEDKDE